MNRGMLVVVMFLPIALAAQERDFSPIKRFEIASAVKAQVSPVDDEAVYTETDSSAPLAVGSESDAPQQPKAAASQPSAARDKAKRKVPGSMVGYIDDPIVGSQIRIRFDDAFEDEFPDRSEFFYAKCGCYTHLNLSTLPPVLQRAYDPNAPGPGRGVPNSINFQQLYMNLEYSPHRRFSGFVEVPIRWLQPQGFQSAPPASLGFLPFSSQSGLSDVTAGLKFAAVESEATYVTFQFKGYFPSGDALEGLGTNHYSIEPSLLLYQQLSDRFTLEGQLGDWHPIGGSAGVPITNSEGFAGDIFFYGIGPSYKVYRGHHVGLAPVVELFGWHVLGGFQTQPVTGTADGAATEVSGMNIVNLKVGVRTNIGFHNSFYVGFGQALTHDDWYKHIVRLEYRYSF